MEISREQAEKTAKRFKDFDEIPNKILKELDSIPFTLLSASQIKLVVKETGAISPFYSEHKEGEKTRLKLSSYEGRIGRQAFQFAEDSAPKRIFFSEKDDFLEIPKNSIVFVECDLDFRLPEFLGARFNLQIVHVHRGLLLGTGPLVDPGFWGKLCIPIHNLTSEDYKIPKDEGLIWLEFTRTTAPISGDPNGEPPFGGREFWDIEEYLDKAQRQFDLSQERPKVPITSSLPIMFDGATEASKRAQEAAEKSADRARNLTLAGGVALFLAFLAVLTLVYDFRSWTSSSQIVINDLLPRIDKIEHEFRIHGQTIQTSAETDAEARSLLTDSLDRSTESLAEIAQLKALIHDQNTENQKLRDEQQRLQISLDELRTEFRNSTAPSQPEQ